MLLLRADGRRGRERAVQPQEAVLGRGREEPGRGRERCDRAREALVPVRDLAVAQVEREEVATVVGDEYLAGSGVSCGGEAEVRSTYCS